MTRDEFLGRLGELLACLPAEQVEETKAFYAEAIADRMEDGMSEECVSSRGFEQKEHRKLSSLSIGSAHAF